MDSKRNLTLRQLTDLSLGFFGVQIAYALQSANISRIFATLGADPHDLSYFWILPPLMGMVVQPLVGSLSDKTWTRLGRRIPYLVFGATVAVIVMCLLPNAGSLGLTVAHSMLFGLVMLMLLDTSINMAMQPFKMLVGDMVSERQKTKAYSIQSLLCNAGSLVGYLFPFLLTALGVERTAAQGVVPPSVVYSFYTGAAIIVVCVLYTMVRVKEMPPKEYREFHNIKVEDEAERDERVDFGSVARLIKGAPRTFWTVGLVQFFCWAAFLYMWTYMTGAVAENGWGATDTSSADYQDAANWVGVLYAVQAIGAIVWATFIPRFKNIKVAYVVSLLIGAIGFASLYFVHDQYVMMLSLALVGPAWAAMLAIPFTLLTNSLEGTPSMGTYLGLFNCTICLPQIVAALFGGSIMSLTGCGQPGMMLVAGLLLACGALAVRQIKVDDMRK
ncbi:MAG: SLC45 family MFS transporter [Marinilabiliaceae bacterium]